MHLYSFVSDYAGYFLLHIQTRHLITHIKHIFLIRNYAKNSLVRISVTLARKSSYGDHEKPQFSIIHSKARFP